MSTNHQFNVEHARLYGLREAILISNLHFWVAHNYANGTHEHDGRTWTYNTVHAFEDLFPYLTYKQIRTSLETLVLREVLVRGNYNKKPSDRTSWFAFTDSFLVENPLPYRANGLPKKTKASAPQGKWDAPQGTASAPQGKSLIEQIVNTDITPSPAAPTEPLAAEIALVIPATDEPEAPKPISAFRLKLAQAKAEREAAKAQKALQAAADREARKAAQADVRKATWAAFDAAYQARYGATFTRNERTNSLMVSFVDLLGADAPHVAAFYLCINDAFVVRNSHHLRLLVSGAETYRTQWVTGQAMTNTRAKQIDQSQANFSAVDEAMAIRRAKQGNRDAQ